MKIKTDQLESLMAIHKHGTFSAAAEALRITQPALSKRIQALEREVGHQVILRGSKPSVLSDAGERLLAMAMTYEKIEHELLDELNQDRPELGGRIRIAASSSHLRPLVLPSLQRLARENPKLHFEFVPAQVSELADLLIRSRVDFIVTDRIPSSARNFVHVQLGEERFGVIEPKSAKNARFIGTDPSDETFFQFMSLQPKHLQEPGPEHSFMGDVFGIFEGVKQGYGKSIVPLHMLRKYGEAVRFNPDYKKMSAPVFLVYPEHLRFSWFLNDVLSSMKTTFPELLADVPG